MLLTTYPGKLIKFLKFKKKFHPIPMNGLDFINFLKSKKRVASQKIASKIDVLGQKYNFPRKMLNCN